MNLFRYFAIILLFSIFTLNSLAIASNKEKNRQGKLADKPLFRDPVFDGAADPTIIWNKNEKKWFMFLLEYQNGNITCNRDKHVYLKLKH